MVRFFVSFLFWIVIFPDHIHAQGIRGLITNQEGDAVPYTAIYVSSLHTGTTANEDGYYQLSLPPGEHKVRYQYLGYQTLERLIEVGSEYETIDIVLSEQLYRLPEVIVTASGEDPAYYIMRRAIGMSQYYLNQVSAYSSMVYLKGSGVIRSMPGILKRQMAQDGVEEGKYFVVENISRIRFELPDRVSTKVIAHRSSGDDNQSNPMAFVTISLYRDINGIISPLSRNAFQVYRFVLEGSFLENGDQVSKIRVIPRRPGPDLYSGFIYIREGSWNLHSVDLQVSQNMFAIGIRQVYNQVAPHVWMPVSHHFEMNFSLLGFEVDFTYLASVSDYEVTLNDEIDHAFYMAIGASSAGFRQLEMLAPGLSVSPSGPPGLSERLQPDALNARQESITSLMAKENLSNRDMRRMNRLIRKEARINRPRESLEVMPADMEVADSARHRSREYWDENRPVPLTEDELASFDEVLSDTTDTQTASERATQGNRTLRRVFMGSRYKIADNWYFQHGGLLGMSSLSFNTVDGYVYEQEIRLGHVAPGGKRFLIANQTSWAFARRGILTKSEVEYGYNPFRRAFVQVSGGRVSADYNQVHGIPDMFNTVTSLFLRQNYMKLYERTYLRINHRIDIANGLVLQTGAEYNQRRQLYNNSEFSYINPLGRSFTPNIPPVNMLPETSLSDHHAALFDISLTYTPRYFYRLVDRRKIMLYSRYPTFGMAIRQGVSGLWNSDVGFTHLEASVRQSFTLQMVGQFRYHMTGGTFFHNEKMYFADYKHFYTNPLYIIPGTDINMFRAMTYYAYSTNRRYATMHLQYDHSRILLKRLPFMADKLLREKVFFSSLIRAGGDPYHEIGYGLDQVFLLFSIEFVTAFAGGRNQYNGFRIGIPLSGLVTINPTR